MGKPPEGKIGDLYQVYNTLPSIGCFSIKNFHAILETFPITEVI